MALRKRCKLKEQPHGVEIQHPFNNVRNNCYRFGLLGNIYIPMYDRRERASSEESQIKAITVVAISKHRGADYRLLLTGTPIQNNLKELWALLNFVHPGNFRSVDDFLEKFGDIKGASQVDSLRKIMGPYVLRRLKHEVETAIPPRQETIIDVELTTLQKQYYRAIFDKNREFLYHGAMGTYQPF